MLKRFANPFLLVLSALVILLVGGALGAMFVKIQYLEGKVGGGQQAGTPTAQAPSAPTAAPTAPTTVSVKVTLDDPVLGSPNAKLTLVEFADYQCPWCARFQTDTLVQVIKDYVDTGKVKFVFKNLAVLGKESTDAANAAMCAKEQNKFWEYHDYLFKHQGPENSGIFSVDNLKKFAVGLGLNAVQFNGCLDKQKYSAQVMVDQAEATRLGFNSTPSIVVGTTPIVGAQPYAQFKTAIDAELAKK